LRGSCASMSMTSFHRRTVATVAPIATVGSASPWVCGVCRTFLHTHDEIVAGDLGSPPGPRTICHSFISRRRTLRGTSQPCLAKISASRLHSSDFGWSSVRLYKYLARSRWVCSSESGASPGALEDSCAVVCSPLRLVVAVPDPVVQTGSPSASSLDLSVIAAGAFCGVVSA